MHNFINGERQRLSEFYGIDGGPNRDERGGKGESGAARRYDIPRNSRQVSIMPEEIGVVYYVSFSHILFRQQSI